MNGWVIASIGLVIVCSVCIVKLLLIYWDIKKMTQQLEGIIHAFGTNEVLYTNTHHPVLSQFILKINQLIHLHKQNQQLQEGRERKLKQEITNISHDLRTPLTSIKGFSELLTDPTVTSEEKERYIMIIQKKIDTLTTQVNQFYELSSIESSDQPIQLENVLLNQLIEEKMVLFYQDFMAAHLEVRISELNEVVVFADYKAVDRILLNLIQNALRYAKSYFEIELLKEDEDVRLRLRNDVVQLDADMLAQLFNRTYRVDTSRSDGQLGLGLHIVQQLVEQQGGKVSAQVESDCFQIDILFKSGDQIGKSF